MSLEQATWQNKAGGEMDKVKDSVRLVEGGVTEVQAAAQNSVQKVNTEITYLREQLAARQLADSAIPSQVLPVTAVDVENSSQSNPELATSAGNYHMSNWNPDNCSTAVCGNATSQPYVNNKSGSAIVNVSSDVFADNSSMNELILPKFYDSSNQIVLHFLRDLDEYYRIKNVPESLKLPLAMRAVTDPIAKSWFSTVYGELKGYEHFKTLFKKFLWNSPTQYRIRCSMYQDKFTKQDGESLTSHYLRYANLAANLQPAMSEDDLIGALTSHYPIVVQRSLISGNIKTTQDAITLLGKLDALEARDDYRNRRQNSETHDASRRPQYNSRDDRTERNRRGNIPVQYVHCTDGSNFDRQRAYGSPNTHDRRGRYDSGCGEQDGRRRSHRTQDSSLSLNSAAQIFEPRTGDTRPNVRQQRPPNGDSGEDLYN